MREHGMTAKGKRFSMIFGLGFVLAIVSGAFIYQHLSSQPQMTLEEALWVTDKEMKNYYPPKSPQSQKIVELLIPKYLDEDIKYEKYVLYRQGLTDTDMSREPLVMSYDFQPPVRSE